MLGTAGVCAPGHGILGGLEPGLDAGGSENRAQDGRLGCVVGLGPGPGTAAPLELVVRGWGQRRTAPGVPQMARGLVGRQTDAPPTCLQVVRMGERESGRAGSAELLPLGKPIQRGRQDPPCGGMGKGRGDPR